MAEIKDLHKKKETLFDLARRFPNKTYRELEKYREEDRQQEAGACIVGEMKKDRGMGHNNPPAEKEIDYHRYWKDMYEKEHKELDRVKKENNDLFLRIAELTEVEESHRKMNGKLQERLTEVEEDNKKLSHQVEDRIERMRKSGM